MTRFSRFPKAPLWLLMVLPFAGCAEPGSPATPVAKGAPASAPAAASDAQAAPTETRTEPAAEPTRAVPSTQPASAGHANRLARETSPYLLLHAHNPVDWYPWGEEALEKARQENKLIFLSIGYSSCYWCHVMERECFMNPEIAAYLNEHFVCIKVDREERPDLDEIYMTALQIYYANTGSPQSGGWPLSMFLTPQAQPLMGGTYFPPEQFLAVLERVEDRWQNDRQTLVTLGEKFAEIVGNHLRGRVPLEKVALDESRLGEIQAALAERFDPEYGGFGYSEAEAQRPKFPDASNLLFLLARARAGNEEAQKMLRLSLDRMAAGGIRDHLGGGFHRYSTDRFWHVPHFEKMLYDQGQLATVYAQAFALTKDPAYRQAAQETCDYVLRELSDPAGGFYSALDAETDGKEGAYYAWSAEEARQALSPEEFELAAAVYGLGGAPNFEDQFVLLWSKPLVEVAQARGQSVEALEAALAPVRAKLLAARNQRKRPLVDTKVLAGWNGLMIRGLAETGRALDDPKYTQAAARAADFILTSLKGPDGRLLRTYGGGQARLNAYLEDYAYLIDGLLALHEVTGERRWLEAAAELQAKQLDLFWDEERGGFYFTSSDHEQLIARVKNAVDSATPSGNAVSAGNLIYLAGAANRPEYFERAQRIFDTFGPQLAEMPSAMPRLGMALGQWLAAGR